MADRYELPNKILGIGRGHPLIGPLYTKMTTPRGRNINLKSAREIFGSLSQTSQFKVALHMVSSTGGPDKLADWLTKAGITNDIAQNTYYDFMCSEAVIPGATLNTVEDKGGRQGVVETMPTQRVFSPVSLTFYVDNEYKILRLFEEWMNFINPVYGGSGAYDQRGIGFGDSKNRNDFHRMRYPDEYKRIISIVKFERNFAVNPAIDGDLQSVPSVTYRLLEAYPSSLTAIPLTYEGSTITKCTVEFTYSRYVYEHHRGELINLDEALRKTR
jgi:hypothetical protein